MRDYKTELDGRLYYQLRGAMTQLQYLCGDSIGPCQATWQQLAAAMAVDLRAAADSLDNLARGGGGAFPVFFSPIEIVEGLDEL